MLQSLQELVAKTYTLVRPYGLKRLLVVFFFVFSQGVFQVLGVTSIFPFLSLAANPGIVRESKAGAWIYELFPGVTDQQLLIAAGIAVVISLVLANVMNLVSELVRTLYVHRFSHWLRMRLVWRYLSRPYGYFLENHTGVMMKKIAGDVNSFTTSVLLSLLDSCARAITALLLFGTLFIVSWQIALAATFILIGYYLAIFALLRGRRKLLSDGINDANRGGWVTLQSLFGGIKPMMVHGVQKTFADAYSRHSMKVVKLAPRMPLYANSPRYFIEPILFGGMTIFIIILIGRGEDINALLPQLGVIGLAGYRLLPAAQLLYGQLSQIDAMRYSLEEVYDELRVAEEPPGQGSRPDLQYSDAAVTPLTIREALRFDNVTFSYPKSEHPAVDRVSLRISKGSSVAFVGHSGSGKSTLVDIMIGLHRPKDGAIWVDDRQLTEDLLPAWRKSLGYVPQDIFLIDASIAQNIAFGVSLDQIDHKRVREVAAQAQILEFIEKELPEGLDTEVGERGVRLSGGQRQRIGLARALYHRPETLILDEATSALDSRTESAFMRAVESLQGQVTIVMIAHRLTTVEKCDCIFLMDHGRLVEQGTYQELLRKSSNFAALASISNPEDTGEAVSVGA